MRVLFISRYRDATMFHKVEWMAQEPDLTIRHIVPSQWRDELLQVEQHGSSVNGSQQRLAIAMFGQPSDPHRAIYRSIGFGLRSFQPDIIHAEEEPDSLATLQIVLARSLFAPKAKLCLHTWQNIDRPVRLSVGIVRRLTLAAADLIFCANRQAIDLLRKLNFQRPTPLLPAVGVDTSVFQPCSGQASNRPFRIGFVGRLDVNKGLTTLVEAFIKLQKLSIHAYQKIELCFIGSGPFEQELRKLVQSEEIVNNVQLIAAMPPAELVKEINRLHVLILPSRTTAVWKEQFGRVLTEAMACKIPVIGSDSGAIPEVIGDAGLIFPEGDVDALVDRLRQLIDSPDLRKDLAERGYQRVIQHYTQQRIAVQTVEVYRQLLGTSQT